MATASMLPQKHGGGEQAQFLPQVAAGSGQEALSEFAGSRDLGQQQVSPASARMESYAGWMDAPHQRINHEAGQQASVSEVGGGAHVLAAVPREEFRHPDSRVPVQPVSHFDGLGQAAHSPRQHEGFHAPPDPARPGANAGGSLQYSGPQNTDYGDAGAHGYAQYDERMSYSAWHDSSLGAPPLDALYAPGGGMEEPGAMQDAEWQLEDLLAHIDALEAELRQSKEMLNERLSDDEVTQIQFQAGQQELAEAKKQVKALELKLADRTKEIEALRLQAENDKDDAQREIAELRDKLSAARAQASDTDQRLLQALASSATATPTNDPSASPAPVDAVVTQQLQVFCACAVEGASVFVSVHARMHTPVCIQGYTYMHTMRAGANIGARAAATAGGGRRGGGNAKQEGGAGTCRRARGRAQAAGGPVGSGGRGACGARKGHRGAACCARAHG